MPQSNKTTERSPRIYILEAMDIYEPLLKEPFIGRQPVPQQDVDISATNMKTGNILQDSKIFSFNLN
jgi:hypothetical protein